MKRSSKAKALEIQGRSAEAKAVLREASKLASEAADRLASPEMAEPTRSIIHRSAMYLASKTGDRAEAIRLAEAALQGNPPEWIRVELVEFLETPPRERIHSYCNWSEPRNLFAA